MNDVKDIKRAEPPYPFEAYAHVMTALSEEDGEGILLLSLIFPVACQTVKRKRKP